MSKIIVANWKMHGNIALVTDLVASGIKGTQYTDNKIIVLPPAVFVPMVRDLAKDSGLLWGAQDCYPGDCGAVTGAISVRMFAEFGCRYLLVGHSERRHLFHEDNACIKAKFVAIQQQQIIPILCVGETEEEYLSGKTFFALAAQLECLRGGIANNFVVAYEPVWAIGTGKTPAISDILVVHRWLRQFLLKECLLDAVSASIIYGGSVNSKNAADIMSLDDVDGVLVGGASLQPQEFLEIATCIK